MVDSGLDRPFRSRGGFGAPSNQGGQDRTLVLSEALTMTAASRLVQQLARLDDPSGAPITVMMSNAPGGEEQAALSVYDALQATSAPVTILGSGRIAGAGVLVIAGAAAEQRVGLPHVRLRLEPPTAPTHTAPATTEAQADEVGEQRERIIEILSLATGRSEEQIASDVSAQRAFEAEEAVEYGLLDRIVQNRREMT